MIASLIGVRSSFIDPLLFDLKKKWVFNSVVNLAFEIIHVKPYLALYCYTFND